LARASQLAAHYGAANLIGVIDVNGLGQRGGTMLGHDGHDMSQILDAFDEAASERSRPRTG
jgi:transketolase N-terminal domain/subunit